MSVTYHFFDFELFKVVHEVGGRPCKIAAVLRSLTVWGQQGSMEYVMDGPGWR